jgi:hypothetical protein
MNSGANEIKTRGDKTRHRLAMAILAIKKGRPKIVATTRKLSISSVAEEAGVTAALIHNRYPDIAEEIRGFTNKTALEKRNKTLESLRISMATNRELRAEIRQLKADLSKLASLNASLMLQNEDYASRVDSTNVVPIKKN